MLVMNNIQSMTHKRRNRKEPDDCSIIDYILDFWETEFKNPLKY